MLYNLSGSSSCLVINRGLRTKSIYLIVSYIHTYICLLLLDKTGTLCIIMCITCAPAEIFSFKVCRPASRLHLQTPWSASICQLYLTMDAFNRYSLIILEYSGIFNRLRFRFPQPHYNYNEDEAVSLLHVLVLGRVGLLHHERYSHAKAWLR